MMPKTSQSPTRRMHGVQFKTAVLAACREPGVSVAAVAQAHGLNANLVRKWLVGRGVKRCGLAGASHTRPMTDAPPAIPFVPVALPVAARPRCENASEIIQVDLTRAGATLKVSWPAGQACAAWLGELGKAFAR